MEFRCPKCDSLIYSRKNKLCGRCGSPLPKELLFTEEEAQQVNKQMEEANKRWKKVSQPEPPTLSSSVDFLP